MGKVTLDERLVIDLMCWHLEGLHEPDREQRIKAGLQAKLDAIGRRRMYTQSRTAATPEEREKARQAYLDAAGIHEDFRWSQTYEERRQQHDD